MAILPLPLAFIACDHVWRDPNTEKRTILGAYSAIEFAEFPARLPEMAVYLAVTGIHGRMVTTVQLVDSAETLPGPVAATEIPLDFNDPVATIESHVVLEDVIFPFPDEYRLQLLVSGLVVIERRILVSNPAHQ